MKHTSNTMKATLQPYSPEELREIAENVRQYRIAHVRDYAYTNERGQVLMFQKLMASGNIHDERLHQITLDLYRRGAHKQKESSSFTYKVIGTTLC